jgi:acyl carrier protein
MQLVMLVTTVCEEAGLPLTAFTERDIRSIKTAYDLIGVVRRAKSSEVQRVEPTA